MRDQKQIGAAIAREKQLKGWNRAWKIKLIEGMNSGWNDLYDRLLGEAGDDRFGWMSDEPTTRAELPPDRFAALWRRLKDHRIARWTVGYVPVAHFGMWKCEPTLLGRT